MMLNIFSTFIAFYWTWWINGNIFEFVYLNTAISFLIAFTFLQNLMKEHQLIDLVNKVMKISVIY